MPDALDGKVALVTGGTSGIGRAAAEQCGARGVRVVITGRDRDRGMEAEEIISASGAEARFIKMDASSEASVRAAVNGVVDRFGGVDFLLSSAGYEGPLGPVTNLSEEACDQLLAVNVKGPIMAAKHVVPQMLNRGGGCIVNVASFLGTIPFPLGVGYGAAKAAVIHLTRSLAADYDAEGIRCYAACPYNTDTPMIERVSGDNEEVRRQLASMNPSGQFASPQDVAKVIVNLFAGARPIEPGSAVLIDAGGSISIASMSGHISAPAGAVC